MKMKQKVMKHLERALTDFHIRNGSIISLDGYPVLNGYHIESARDGVYVWRLIFPLFDSSPFHLTYSSRISSGFLEVDGNDSATFAKRIEFFIRSNQTPVYAEVRGIDGFCNYMEAEDRGIRSNPHAGMIFGLALGSLGRLDEAKEVLLRASEEIHMSDMDDLKNILDAVDDGASRASKVAEDYIAANVARLRI